MWFSAEPSYINLWSDLIPVMILSIPFSLIISHNLGQILGLNKVAWTVHWLSWEKCVNKMLKSSMEFCWWRFGVWQSIRGQAKFLRLLTTTNRVSQNYPNMQFSRFSLMCWNRWCCGYQSFLKYSLRVKAKCHTLPVRILFRSVAPFSAQFRQ